MILVRLVLYAPVSHVSWSASDSREKERQRSVHGNDISYLILSSDYLSNYSNVPLKRQLPSGGI
jgi:hypothetical protein